MPREVPDTSSIRPFFCLQVLLGGVERAEPEGAADFLARGRRAGFHQAVADELQDFALARSQQAGEGRHGFFAGPLGSVGSLLTIYTVTILNASPASRFCKRELMFSPGLPHREFRSAQSAR
jgi:hypothetical protein